MPAALDSMNQDKSAEESNKPVFVMNSLSDRPTMDQGRYLSSESLEDHNSTTSSTESNSASGQAHRKDHEFIPTRMKTISASKPAADPKQFTRIPSNPLLISAQKQLLLVEEVKKKKEVVKRGDDEPDWQNNLSSWKDKRRKQSEEALQRVAEVKALESDGDDFNQRQKLSIGKKLSTLLYTNGEEDWSDLGLEKSTSSSALPSKSSSQSKPPENSGAPKKRMSLPAPSVSKQAEVVNKDEVKKEVEEITNYVKSVTRTPGGGGDGYGEGVPVLNRKTSAPVMPYGSPRGTSEDKEVPAVRRKSSELSTSMKSRLEAFTKQQQEEEAEKAKTARTVEPDETFREKLRAFRKISEAKAEEEVPKGPKPPLSYKTLIGNNFGQSNMSRLSLNNDHDNVDHNEDNEDEDVDQLLDDALEESYRSVLEDENDKNGSENARETLPSSKAPPTEKPPPPPVSEANDEETEKNRRNLLMQPRRQRDEELDKQEQAIIASIEFEEREHKKYMDTVNAMRNLSPVSSDHSQSSSGAKLANSVPQPFGKKSMSPTFRNVSPALSGSGSVESRPSVHAPMGPIKKKSEPGGGVGHHAPPVRSSYNQQHWLIQEAEQRRITEQQMRSSSSSSLHQQPYLQSQSPVYENSNYVGGLPVPHVPPPNQYTNHQRPPSSNGIQPPLNENMYANLGQHPPIPPNFQRDIPPGPPSSTNAMRGLPGPQVPPRNPQASDGSSSSMAGSSDRLLSVSGKKKCSHCKEELGRGAAMIIESLRLFYHLRCFKCVVCSAQLGNGSTGTDVRVRNNKLHCQNCYSNDEGLKFSKV